MYILNIGDIDNIILKGDSGNYTNICSGNRILICKSIKNSTWNIFSHSENINISIKKNLNDTKLLYIFLNEKLNNINKENSIKEYNKIQVIIIDILLDLLFKTDCLKNKSFSYYKNQSEDIRAKTIKSQK